VGVVAVAGKSRDQFDAQAGRNASCAGSCGRSGRTGVWDTIKGSDSAADFKAYLDSYPDGPFAAAARARLQQIETKVVSKPAVPETGACRRLNPPSGTVRNVRKWS